MTINLIQKTDLASADFSNNNTAGAGGIGIKTDASSSVGIALNAKVPSGGSTSQVLTKQSNGSNAWATPSSGGNSYGGVLASLVSLDDHGIVTAGPLPTSGTWLSALLANSSSIICSQVVATTGPTNQWVMSTSGDYVQVRDQNGTWYNTTAYTGGRYTTLAVGAFPVQVARYSYLSDPQNIAVQMSGSTG